MENKYIIPTELEAPIKVLSFLYFFDVAFIFIYWVFMDNYRPFVHESIAIGYMIANIIIPVLCVRQSKSPQRRVFQTVIFAFMKKKKVYHTRREEESTDVIEI